MKKMTQLRECELFVLRQKNKVFLQCNIFILMSLKTMFWIKLSQTTNALQFFGRLWDYVVHKARIIIPCGWSHGQLQTCGKHNCWYYATLVCLEDTYTVSALVSDCVKISDLQWCAAAQIGCRKPNISHWLGDEAARRADGEGNRVQDNIYQSKSSSLWTLLSTIREHAWFRNIVCV